MRIFFEDYPYEASLVDKTFGSIKKVWNRKKGYCTSSCVGHIYCKNDSYTGSAFMLPKAMLLKVGDKMCVLGIPGAYPEKVIDLDDPLNPLSDNEVLLKDINDLSLWIYGVIERFWERNKKNSKQIEEADLQRSRANTDTASKDFLSMAKQLVDFYKAHKNIFTTITLLNHSGNNNVSWQKTITKRRPHIGKDGIPIYVETLNKKKEIDTDEKLIVLFYSVLKFLNSKYPFYLHLDDILYPTIPVSRIEVMLDGGIVPKALKGTRNLYHREDLRELWKLLETFFKYNQNIDKNKQDRLYVRKFHLVFEDMIDQLISDDDIPEKLKVQRDAKIVDHLYRDRSLLDPKNDIYFIGDSKYYKDKADIDGTSLYKQFTYARNAILFNIEQYYLEGNRDPKLRYRDSFPSDMPLTHVKHTFVDSATEGYNITPNFFIRSSVTRGEINTDKLDFRPLKMKDGKDISKHFEDRLFDRDTLLLKEFGINLFFVMVAYASIEDWSEVIRGIIRQTLLENLDSRYKFYRIKVKDLPVPFMQKYFHLLIGKAYRTGFYDDHIILAFERSPQGEKDEAHIWPLIQPDLEDRQEFTLAEVEAKYQQELTAAEAK